MGPLTLFSESLDARITYEGRLADAKRECEGDVQRARERMAREEIRLRREYEDSMQRQSLLLELPPLKNQAICDEVKVKRLPRALATWTR